MTELLINSLGNEKSKFTFNGRKMVVDNIAEFNYLENLCLLDSNKKKVCLNLKSEKIKHLPYELEGDQGVCPSNVCPRCTCDNGEPAKQTCDLYQSDTDDTDNVKCISCNKGFELIDGKCYGCANNYYKDDVGTDRCKPCDEECNTSTEGNSERSTNIVKGCGGENKGYCDRVECNCDKGKPADTCTRNNRNKCSNCDDNHYLNDSDQCIECPENYNCDGRIRGCKKTALKTNDDKCVPCPDNATCNGTNIFTCNEYFTKTKNGDKCERNSCPINQLLNNNLKTCLNCPDNATCNGTANFTCNNDKLQNKTNFSCDACPSNSECNGTDSIVDCVDYYTLDYSNDKQWKCYEIENKCSDERIPHYKYYNKITEANKKIDVVLPIDNYDILLVGGGGAGGGAGGSGGGGDVIEYTNLNLSGKYDIFVGGGGKKTSGIGPGGCWAENGKNSYIKSDDGKLEIIAAGGGGGSGNSGQSCAYRTNGVNANTTPTTTFKDPNTNETITTSGGGGGTDYRLSIGKGSGNGVSGDGGWREQGYDHSEWRGGAGGGAKTNGGNSKTDEWADSINSTQFGRGGYGQKSDITGIEIGYGGGGSTGTWTIGPKLKDLIIRDNFIKLKEISPEIDGGGYLNSHGINGRGGGGSMGKPGGDGVVIIRSSFPYKCRALDKVSGPVFERLGHSSEGNYKYAWILSWREGNWYSYVIWNNYVVLFKNHGGPFDNRESIWIETAEEWTSPIWWDIWCEGKKCKAQTQFRRYGTKNIDDDLKYKNDYIKCGYLDKKLSTVNYSVDPFKNNNGICGNNGMSSNNTWFYSVRMKILMKN